MNINDYKITEGDNNTIIFTDNYGISYRVDINNYNVGEHTYIYENTRQTTNAYTTNPGYVYSQNITQGNSIGVTFPDSLVQSSSSPSTGRYHTTEQFRTIAATSTEEFMNNLPGLIGRVNGTTNTVTTISSNTEPNYTVVSRGWSGGTQPAVELAAANGSSVAVMIDPNRSGSDAQGLEQPSTELYQALRDNGTVIVSIKGSSSESDIATYTERGAIDNGIPVIVVRNNSLENHTALENFASQTRVDAFLSGEISYEQFVANCRSRGYDPNSVSLLRVTGYNTNGVSITEELSFNDYASGVVTTPNSFSAEDLREEYSELSDFASKYQDSGDTLASNLSFVNNSMSDIRGQITEHQDVNYVRQSDNEAGIVGALYGVTNYYGSITNVLYGNLNAETQAIYGIANAIYQMDEFSSVMAESTLSDGISSLYSTSNPEVAEQLEKLTSSAGLLDLTKNAVMAGGRYDELTNILSMKTEAGNVGKISISSLESAISLVVPALENEVTRAQSLKSGVTDFMTGIGTNNILQGGVWDAVKTNMANYENLLDANVKASTFIQDSVLTAMGMVVDYIQGASSKISSVASLAEYGGLATSINELDDSKLSELTGVLTDIGEKIDETDATVKQMEASRHIVEDGYLDKETGLFVKTGEHQEPSEEEIQVYRDLLTKYVDIKTVLDEYKGVLEGLAPVVLSAQNLIQDAVNQVKDMYENPVQDTQGNITFNSDFNLDLSPYSEYIDTTKDYKQLINDYHEKLLEGDNEEPEEIQVGTDPVGDEDYYPDNDPLPENDTKPQPGTTPKTEPQVVPKTEPKTEAPTKPEKGPDSRIEDVPTEPIIEIPDDGDEIIDYPVLPDEEGYVNVPYHSIDGDEPQITLLDSSMDESTDIVDFNEPIELDNPYYEPKIEQPKVVNLVHSTVESQPQVKPESTIKTMGVATGAGIALGAAALAAHSTLSKKDDDEEEEDFGYEK